MGQAAIMLLALILFFVIKGCAVVALAILTQEVI
jgi:hypothetical protein